MSTVTLHNIESAPAASKPLLAASLEAFGMIPNLHAVMAESPQLLAGYQQMHELVQKTAFTKEELTVVWQTINVEHACMYCVPAHTNLAYAMGISEDVVKALRDETPLASNKLSVLRETTLEIVRERGHLSGEQKDTFHSAGFTQQHLFDILLVLAQKIMSNYVNHVAETPLDEPFQKFDWKKA